MINRDDMLELTRRMTPQRTCFSRIAGCYMDDEGYEDGSFNIHFGKLSVQEKKRNLDIAKSVIISKTNVQLKEYSFADGAARQKSMWPLLTGLKESGLKDDGLLSIFYEVISERYPVGEPYAIYMFYGSYDVPVKGTDGQWNEGSEEMYDFIICAIAPYSGDYEVGEPEFGFLYPAFSDRSSDRMKIDIFNINPDDEKKDIASVILG